MRIAVAADGTRGDLYPLLAAGEALRAHGHEIVVCGPPNFRDVVTERGMIFRPVGLDVRAFLRDKAAAITGGNARLVRETLGYLGESIRLQFAQLPAATADADRILGAGVQAAAPSAAELHGIPYRYIVYCPVLFPSAEYGPAGIATRRLPRWVNRVAWRVNLALYRRLLGSAFDRERAVLGLGPVDDAYAYLLGGRPLLAADPELADVPADCDVAADQVPALHPLSGDPLPEKLETFLAQGPAPVYFGFGSMTDPQPERTTRTILAAVEQVGCRAILSSGWAELGGVALPEGVIQIGAVSHARLFARTAAVVHHGGAGTTTTAARAGTPQIVVPHVLDQYYWADRVHGLGIGPPGLRRTRFTRDGLADALRATLENEWLAERAAALGKRLRQRFEAAGDPTPALLAD